MQVDNYRWQTKETTVATLRHWELTSNIFRGLLSHSSSRLLVLHYYASVAQFMTIWHLVRRGEGRGTRGWVGPDTSSPHTCADNTHHIPSSGRSWPSAEIKSAWNMVCKVITIKFLSIHCQPIHKESCHECIISKNYRVWKVQASKIL